MKIEIEINVMPDLDGWIIAGDTTPAKYPTKQAAVQNAFERARQMRTKGACVQVYVKHESFESASSSSTADVLDIESLRTTSA